MKAKKRILFLGYDFELKNQRGIGFYSKSLIKTCYEMGFDNYIMTSAPDSKYQNIRELLIYQKLMNPEPFARRSKIGLLSRLIKAKLDLFPRYRTIESGFIKAHDQKLNYLDYCRGFVNKPRLYDLLELNSRFLESPYHIKPGNADILFCTAPLAIKTSYSTKLIQTLHDVIPLFNLNHNGDNPTIFYRRMLNALRHSDKVISVSQFSKEEALKVFPGYEDKIEVTYQPIPIYPDEEKMSEEPLVQEGILKSYGLEKNGYFLYNGFLERRKNIENLIQAYSAIGAKVKIPLVLAGAIDHKDIELVKLIKNSLRQNVIYLGYISTVAKLVLLRNATAFVFPSQYEGFGIPPIEAMKMNCPVISSNTTSLKEVCEDGAVLVNPFSVSEIAEAMETLVSNSSLREKLIRNGAKRVDFFSYENFKKRILPVLGSN
jgi:glycosyltransferase involved in cell wall biosynthesis